MQFGLIAAGIAMLLAVFGPVEGAELGIKHSRGKREGKGISFLDDRTQQFLLKLCRSCLISTKGKSLS